MRKPIQIALYICRGNNEKREWLLLRRIPESGGFWQGVTGGVEDDETILATATRELKEETGFTGLKIIQLEYCRTFPVPDSMKYHYQPDVQVLTEYAFCAEVLQDIDPVLDLREHTGFRWVSYETALELLHYPGNIEALKMCEELLRD